MILRNLFSGVLQERHHGLLSWCYENILCCEGCKLIKASLWWDKFQRRVLSNDLLIKWGTLRNPLVNLSYILVSYMIAFRGWTRKGGQNCPAMEFWNCQSWCFVDCCCKHQTNFSNAPFADEDILCYRRLLHLLRRYLLVKVD